MLSLQRTQLTSGVSSLKMMQQRRAQVRQQQTVCGAHTVTLLDPKGKTIATIKADSARSIYDYAEYNGVHLPASCKQGSCSACVAKVLHGKVDQHAQTCLPPSLVKEGFVALCCATPLTDVTIETGAGAEARRRKRAEAEAASAGGR